MFDCKKEIAGGRGGVGDVPSWNYTLCYITFLDVQL